MKPILILKINLGEEAGGIVPLKVLYNDDNYFRDLTDEFCSLHHQLNDSKIKEIIYNQIKSGVKHQVQKSKLKKAKENQFSNSTVYQTFEQILNKENQDIIEGRTKYEEKVMQFNQNKSNQNSNGSQLNQEAPQPSQYPFQQQYIHELQFLNPGPSFNQLNQQIPMQESQRNNMHVKSKSVQINGKSTQYAINYSPNIIHTQYQTNQDYIDERLPQNPLQTNTFDKNQQSEFQQEDFEQNQRATGLNTFGSPSEQSLQKKNTNQNDVQESNYTGGATSPNEQNTEFKQTMPGTEFQDQLSEAFMNNTGTLFYRFESPQVATPGHISHFQDSILRNGQMKTQTYNFDRMQRSISRGRNTPEGMKRQITESSNRLYNQSKLNEQKISKMREEISLERQMQEQKDLTFRPQICKRSVQMVHDRKKRHNQYYDQTNLFSPVSQTPCSQTKVVTVQNDEQPKNEKRYIIEEYHQKVHDAVWPFRPQILKKSQRIVQEKRRLSREKSPCFETLYKEKFEREKKLKVLQDKSYHDEQMSIEKSKYSNQKRRKQSSKLNEERSQSRSKSKEHQKQHIEQLISFKSKLNHSVELQRLTQKYIQETFDVKTGQELYVPKISRGPKGHEDQEFRDKIDICTRMYYFMYIKKENQIANEEREMHRIKESSSKSVMSDNSKKIVNKMKLKRLKELFQVIDNDNDGVISENSLLNAQLPLKTLAVLRPLIKDGKKLDFDTFLNKLQSCINLQQL